MAKVFTLNGELINVGPWDYNPDPDSNPPGLPSNPLPEGAIEEERKIAWTANNMLVLAGDPRAVRPYTGPE
ncbi:hypothetical protein [Leclercia sp. W6]|uniref:hypothetical protein n=1 Tax=Leclercia sp. W6 TaxID=2282310 RepID=UPI0011C04D19|nr:hypothetical protein [Leclercia sp. W6]